MRSPDYSMAASRSGIAVCAYQPQKECVRHAYGLYAPHTGVFGLRGLSADCDEQSDMSEIYAETDTSAHTGPGFLIQIRYGSIRCTKAGVAQAVAPYTSRDVRLDLKRSTIALIPSPLSIFTKSFFFTVWAACSWQALAEARCIAYFAMLF